MKPSAKLGYQIGAVVALVFLAMFLLPGQEALHTLGPANTGHEALGCQDCHVTAPGTARQQIQANMRYWVDQRQSSVDFQHQPILNATCIDCHNNPKDSHPAHRFNEPRFAEARLAIAPQDCVSCHSEHQGRRVTIEPNFCVHCHADLTLKNEPLDVSHEQLIAGKDWAGCLGCHDFHGNHEMAIPTRIEDAIEPLKVLSYFEGDSSPYSDQKFYPATVREKQE